jgi:hypothetical protein
MAHTDADIALDFYADWMETLRGALRNLGYSPPTDDQDAQIAYFNAHGPKASPWSDVQVLERFAETWPDQMSRYELRGIAPGRSGSNPTSAELGRLRSAGVQALITIGGKVYGPMGGGLSTAKVSMDVVSMMDRCVRIVLAFEQHVAEAKKEIFEKAIEHGIDLVRPVRFRMVARADGSALATTEDWRFGFPLGQIT